MKNAIIEHMHYAHEHGTDRPEIVNWTWPPTAPANDLMSSLHCTDIGIGVNR
jgi:hypothetical protein